MCVCVCLWINVRTKIRTIRNTLRLDKTNEREPAPQSRLATVAATHRDTGDVLHNHLRHLPGQFLLRFVLL